MAKKQLHFLCISRYFKGSDFLQSIHENGHKVYLLTSSKLKNEDWPWQSISDVYFIDEDEKGRWNTNDVVEGLAFTMRSVHFDAFIALDDYDVEKVAHLREHFRIGGMGETTSRHFRDKLAMRAKTKDAKLPSPKFVGLFNDQTINEFLDSVPGPWILKPRSAASAQGMKKLKSKEEAWSAIHALQSNRHGYLIESFTPGDVFHVDGLVDNGKVIFTRVSQYLDTPFEVAHDGGIFRSQTVPINGSDSKELIDLNKRIIKAFGLHHGAFHSEYIKSHADGSFFFLETSSRVGGANLAEMVETASGVNLWREWAKIEIAFLTGGTYKLPSISKAHAGIIVSLSRFQNPDSSPFQDSEIVWRMKKEWHIGLIIKSSKQERVRELLDKYTEIVAKEYHASLPSRDTHYNP